MCETCQPKTGVRVGEREGNAVGSSLRDSRPSLGIRIHRFRCLRGAVHLGGRECVLVVVPGDLWEHGEFGVSTRTAPAVPTADNHTACGQEKAWILLERGEVQGAHLSFHTEIFMVEVEHNYPWWLKEQGVNGGQDVCVQSHSGMETFQRPQRKSLYFRELRILG